MPTKYAIRTRTDVQLTRQEQYMIDTQGWKVPEDKYTYEEVPAIVAEFDTENGVYALFSSNGVKLSEWLLITQVDDVQKQWRLGRTKPGPVLKDSIGQDINQGDYLVAHRQKEESLELCQVVRNMQTKTATENLSSSRFASTAKAIQSRDPETYVKLPSELIEGGMIPTQHWEKRFALRFAEHIPYQGTREDYTLVDEDTAMKDESGHFGYFNNGVLVSGWIPCPLNPHTARSLEDKIHSKKKIMESLEVPLTDSMGTDIVLGDWVFSNYSNATLFMLCEVIGFTKDRVRLMGYANTSPHMGLQGQRIITLNPPKNILKLPVQIHS
jgi:hypothetical protein